jgi:transcriptional antiterminator NusG
MNMKNLIFDVVVPTEKKIVVKGGKRVEVREKIYPGYVLVDMIVTDESWYVARNTPRVTGFVGSGTHPVPLSELEVKELFSRMEADTAKHAIDLSVGDIVSITDGPFKELEGKVGDIDEERGKVKVMVPMFGRDTPVELDFVQVTLI